MSILETKVSWFKTTRQTEVQKAFPIKSFLALIKGNKYKSQIDKVRKGDKEEKKQLPTVAMHGIFNYSRSAKNFQEASGLIILDIDKIPLVKDEEYSKTLERVKEEIMESSDSIFAVMISPSANGIKVLYYVDPDSINRDNYRAIGKEIITGFADFGEVDFLSLTDTLIMTHDPNILINEEAEADVIHIKEVVVKESKLESRDASKILWDDAEEFFDVVLDQQIIQRVTSNYHYIQVAILELAKFGFKHPAHDLQFVIHFSESHFKISGDNKQRLREASNIAKDLPHTRWAYDTRAVQHEAEEIDYSVFQDDEQEAGVSVYEDDGIDDEEDEEEDETGVVDYSNLYKNVVTRIKEGDRVGREISLENFANAFRFRGTGILTVTGIPGHGKTEFIDAIIIDLARLYRESSLIIGFEQTPEEHIIKLSRKLMGVNITYSSWWNDDNEKLFKKNYDFVTEKIQHIDVKKHGGIIEKLLLKAAEWIQQQRKKGADPKYVVVDPFNMLSSKGKMSGHEKAEEILRQLTHFSHQMNVLVILVAHPFKMKKNEKTGEYEIPDFYSVKGSSAFFEMSYHGLTIYRINGTVLVRVLKAKQNNIGETGADVWFMYDKDSGRYIPCDEDGLEMAGDHRDKDWLNKIEEL